MQFKQSIISWLHHYHIGEVALSLALVFVIVSTVYSHHLVYHMAQSENKQMEIWAEATRQFIQADADTDIDFVSSIIEGNTTIPVYMLDANGQILAMRNVRKPVDDPTTLMGPIEVHIDEQITQYIYYDESITLRQLRLFPLFSLGIIAIFLLTSFIAVKTTQRSQQDRVWAGLSKETAHQLGTPISSLVAWQELLKSRYPQDELIPQMQLDINRLQAIAERFSKIGSIPELTLQPLMPVIEQTIGYMQARVSKKVQIDCLYPEQMRDCQVRLNTSLFQWVLENLLKNALDAMGGVGKITFHITQAPKRIFIDVSDTGKGMERKMFKRIFVPGFTTKQRGWGLGLSLSKRIVEDYHGGKLFVLQSELEHGTTFRIVLKNTEDGATTA